MHIERRTIWHPRLGGLRNAALAAAVLLLSARGILAATGPAAIPTVGQLLEACERGRAQGNKGVDAALCEWYAAPCACKLRVHGAADEQLWCVPESETLDATVEKVLAELRRSPDRNRPAEPTVAEILRRLYPCASPEHR